MKRLFAFAGLMTAAAISLTNCQPKEIGIEQVPSASKTIYISASTAADTKTKNNDMQTLWEAADTMNVFCNESGSYVSLGKATVAEGAGTTSATFEIEVPTGTVLPSGPATWYAFFPYQKQMASPEGTSGYAFLGNSKGVTQDGFGSKAHLCGNVCPMYGVAEGNGPTVSLGMKHLTSVIEFNITNSTGQSIIVNSVTVTASEDIVGTYYYDLTGEEVVYTPSGANYVYKSATVNIEDSTLEEDETGKVYLPIKPYTQEGVFKVSVSCSVGGNTALASFDLNPTGKQAVFSAGKIKPVALNITKLDTGGNTVAQALAAEGTFSLKNVQVASIVGRNVFVRDNTGTILAYTTNDVASGLAVGDYVDVEGTTKYYNNLTEFNSPTITKLNSGTISLNAVTWSDAQMASAYGNAKSEYVTYQATFTAARNATIPGSEAIIYTTNASSVSITAGKVYTVTGFVYGWTDYEDKSGNVTKEVCMYVETAEEVTEEPPVTEGTTVSMTMKEYQEGNNCTLSAGSDVFNYKVLDLSSAVRMMSTGSSNNCGSFWTSGSNVEWRLYRGGSETPDNLIIKVASGCNLKSVKLTFGTQNNGILLNSSNETVASGTAYEVSGTSVTYVLGNSDETKNNGQIKITAVEIVYTGSGTLQPEAEQEIETSISLKSSAMVYIGETLELNATSNAKEATITYESEDVSIATVSSTGVVTGVSEGEVKIYARIEGVAGKYTSDEKYCTVTVTEKPSQTDGTWVETAFASIANGAQFVVVSIKESAAYAMTNDKGTSSSPVAVAVTITNNKLAASPASNLVWEMAKDGADVRFKLPGEDKYLYFTKSNTGLRVGTNENNVIVMDSASGYLTGNDSADVRYIGVYNNQDWRSYKSVNDNIKDQTFKFYVKQ